MAAILTLGEVPLQLEEELTYLGATCDRKQTWKPHLQKAKTKARRKLATKKTLSGTTWRASENILKTVYQGVVRPHLEYGFLARGNNNAEQVVRDIGDLQRTASFITTTGLPV